MKKEEWNIQSDEVEDLLKDDAKMDDPNPEIIVAESTESEEKKGVLTRKQKILSGVTVLLSFLFFMFFFFPYGDLAIYVMMKVVSPVQVQYMTLEPSLFGPTSASSLVVTLPDGSSFEADEAYVEASLLSLMGGRLKGNAYLKNLRIQTQNFSATAKMVDTSYDISEINGPMNQWTGSLQVSGSNVEPGRIPTGGFPLPVNPEELVISKLRLIAEMDGSKINLDGTKLESDLFNVAISEGGKPGATLESISLDAGVCLTPAKDLEKKNRGLFDMYALAAGGTAEETLCFSVNGRPGSPTFTRVE